jgi:hypothetical protein
MSVNYVLTMRSESIVEDKMADYVRSVCPEAKAVVLENTWQRLKAYFSPENQHNLTHLAPVLNVPDMVAAFAGAAVPTVDIPSLNLSPGRSLPTQHEAPQVSQATQAAASSSSPNSSSTRSSSILSSSMRSNSSRTASSRSSKSSTNKLNNNAVLRLLKEFNDNFKGFAGGPWILSSGTIVDDVLAALAQRQAYEQSAESELHSFVIEDVEEALAAFEDEGDRAEVRAILETRPGEPLQELDKSESAYLSLYAKDPEEVGKLLDKSWTDISLDPPDKNPGDKFRQLIHHWMRHLHFVYSIRSYQLPAVESESWFLNMLWGPLALVLDIEKELQYKHAEYNSSSSALRKNVDRKRGKRQAVGRKADGMILGTSTGLEICVLEAAKKDDGPRSTKALCDTLKIAKVTKDMMDVMRAKVPDEVHHQLVVYWFRITAASMHLYTLQQRPGRFNQLFYERLVPSNVECRNS